MPLNLKQVPARYRLDIEALLTSLLPALLRQPRMIAWVQALHLPLVSLYEQFIEHVKRSTTELSYNGQTMMLEKALNDRFDPGFRRIRIINSDTELEPVYLNFLSEQQPMPALYFEDEGQPLLYLNRWNEYTNQVGFTVQVPRALASKEASIQARIKQLKLALIRHKIVYR